MKSLFTLAALAVVASLLTSKLVLAEGSEAVALDFSAIEKSPIAAGPTVDFRTLWAWAERREQPLWAVAKCSFDAGAAARDLGFSPYFKSHNPGVNPYQFIPTVAVATYGSRELFDSNTKSYSREDAQRSIRNRLSKTCREQMRSVISELMSGPLNNLREENEPELMGLVHIDPVTDLELRHFDPMIAKTLHVNSSPGQIDDWGYTTFQFSFSDEERQNIIANLNSVGSCSRDLAPGAKVNNCDSKGFVNYAKKLAKFEKTKDFRILMGSLVGGVSWMIRGGSILPLGSTFLARMAGASGIAAIRLIVMGKDANVLDLGLDASRTFIAENLLTTHDFLSGGTADAVTQILSGTYYGSQTGFIINGFPGLAAGALFGLVYYASPLNQVSEFVTGAILGYSKAQTIAKQYELSLIDHITYDYNEVIAINLYATLAAPQYKRQMR